MLNADGKEMMKSNETEFLQHIRKIYIIETGYTRDRRVANRINRLLAEGWTLLEVQKVLYGDGTQNENIIYHLGHTDPNADTH